MPNLTHFDTLDEQGNITRYMFQDDVTYNAIRGLVDRVATNDISLGSWTIGAINPDTGAASTSESHANTPSYINASILKIAIPSDYIISVFGYINNVFQGCFNGVDFASNVSYFMGACYLFNIPSNYTLRVDVQKTDETNISNADLQDIETNILGYNVTASLTTLTSARMEELTSYEKEDFNETE